MHTYTPPEHIRDVLWAYGWPTEPTLDDVELAGAVLGGGVSRWASKIVSTVNRGMPVTTGGAYLDEEYHIVGVCLASGGVAGQTTDNLITGLDRDTACFTLRALRDGFTRVRPMPMLPVAILHLEDGRTYDGALVAAGGGAVDVPPDARVFAEVDPAEREVVYDLWAVASSTTETGVAIWRRHDGQWMDDPGWLSTLYSENLPALVYIPTDDPVLSEVTTQIDVSTKGKPFEAITASITLSPEFYVDLLPLIAAGRSGTSVKEMLGIGKGGGAEVLRRYWATGKGATKIRWGVGGDWYRCVKHLRKYMGSRAKGYCNKLHHRVLGYYPATHAKMIKAGKGQG